MTPITASVATTDASRTHSRLLLLLGLGRSQGADVLVACLSWALSAGSCGHRGSLLVGRGDVGGVLEAGRGVRVLRVVSWGLGLPPTGAVAKRGVDEYGSQRQDD